MWGALLARALTAAGVVVVIPDLRNYPLVSIPQMVDDVDSALDWTSNNISQYGGDPTNIVVVGQSAGGHVACVALFRKIRKNIDKNNDNAKSNGEWMTSHIKGFAAVSSPLNLGSPLTKSFRRLGFDDVMVDRMFGFQKDKYDPYLTLEELQNSELEHEFLKALPPFCIYQGTDDKTVPFEVSESFYRKLSNTSSNTKSVSFVLYDGWSHTDPILEGPMDADHRLHKDLLDNVNEWTTVPNLTWPTCRRLNGRLCPHFMVEISRFINPF
ncbi:unnamed protein product [Pseudo-nitzschia multistriata]|uniref:BD-FAE-like domain-containing protein n=2 Tax=Pseudo-nitzschia multistriata TaxID=183589 RepID=A0A448ZL91_9STRA|nr:unnamed protein product [Pseudo-nitzschia multistriata]